MEQTASVTELAPMTYILISIQYVAANELDAFPSALRDLQMF